MGGGEVQLAAVLKHLGGISFVCFELILTERGCNIFEYLSEAYAWTQQRHLYVSVVSLRLRLKSYLEGIFNCFYVRKMIPQLSTRALSWTRIISKLLVIKAGI